MVFFVHTSRYDWWLYLNYHSCFLWHVLIRRIEKLSRNTLVSNNTPQKNVNVKVDQATKKNFTVILSYHQSKEIFPPTEEPCTIQSQRLVQIPEPSESLNKSSHQKPLARNISPTHVTSRAFVHDRVSRVTPRWSNTPTSPESTLESATGNIPFRDTGLLWRTHCLLINSFETTLSSLTLWRIELPLLKVIQWWNLQKLKHLPGILDQDLIKALDG